MIWVSNREDFGVDEREAPKNHTWECACGKEISHTGQTEINAEAIDTTVTQRNYQNCKGKGKKSQNIPDEQTVRINDDTDKQENFQGSTESATADKEEVSNHNSQDVTETEQSGIFDEQVKVDTEGRQSEENGNKETKPFPASRDQKLRSMKYIGKSCKNKRHDKIPGHRKAISCSSNNYIIEVEDESTGNSSYLSSDSEVDDLNESKEIVQNQGTYQKSKSSKRKCSKGYRVRGKRPNVNFQKDDFDFKKLVMKAEDIE